MLSWFNKINRTIYKFDKKETICLYILIFLAGSVVGYIYEEIFCLLFDHELVNRGFLYGPYLPVYGFGAALMILLLKKFKRNPLVVFLLAMLSTGILEYLTGYLLWEIYHKTWWDYTGLFLNIDGYVCLRSVLTFGIGGLLLIYIVEPLICLIMSKTPKKKIYTMSSLSCIIILIDLVLTMMFRNKI